MIENTNPDFRSVKKCLKCDTVLRRKSNKNVTEKYVSNTIELVAKWMGCWEYMKVTCNHCGYKWDENTADYEKK